jgi:hypothetical protein
MLSIISNISDIENPTVYDWRSLKPKQNITVENRDCILNTGQELKVSVIADTQSTCSICGIDGFFLNFDAEGQKIIVSPSRSEGKPTQIELRFSRPVHAAGARIGIIHDNSPRSFFANFVVIDKDGKEHPSNSISGSSTNSIDRSGLFLGAVCKGDHLLPEISALKFSVSRANDSPRFDLFAIGSLVYMENHIR